MLNPNNHQGINLKLFCREVVTYAKLQKQEVAILRTCITKEMLLKKSKNDLNSNVKQVK
jgi:hypothetical protein